MAKKKVTKKGSSERAARGKASVKKGARFEEMVADLYRLLGAKVTPNVEICQKKVDVFAVFPLPGSGTGHRVIVECKQEKTNRAQNQRVMEFKGLLDTARKAGEADSAEIITRAPWSDQAKGFGLKSGVELLTYEQKMAQLIDFKTYLSDVVTRFTKSDPGRPSEPPLDAYYVDLSAERRTRKGVRKIKVIDKYIQQWLRRETVPHLAILGGYGTGKTCLGKKLAHDLAETYLEAPGSSRIPVLFNLREFTKTLKIESLVTSFLDDECGVINPRFKLFNAMNQAGIFLVIFDGFDEMAVRVDVDTLEMNIQEIDKLAGAPKSKVIMTSRIEYFVSGEEEKTSLSPKGELLATREIEYEPIRIVPWGDAQVNTFLKKRVPLIKGIKKRWTYYRDRINGIPGLADLSRRPVLLDMIAKTLPQLIASGKPIDRPSLYETYLTGEIKRQKIMKKRRFLLSEDRRFSVLERLALDFSGGKTSTVSFADAAKYMSRFVKPPKQDLEAYTRDFLTGSFLMREGDHYRFSHRSIMEFLAAKALLLEITANKPKAFLRQRLPYMVAGFLSELTFDQRVLWDWLTSTQSAAPEDVKFLGGNAATLICKQNRSALASADLSGMVLAGVDLRGADLTNANLESAILKHANLVDAKFQRKNLSRAVIGNLRVRIYCFTRMPASIPSDPLESREAARIEHQRDLLNLVINKLDRLRFRMWAARYYPRQRDLFFFWALGYTDDHKSLQLIKRELTEKLAVQVAVYRDEVERILNHLPRWVRTDFRADQESYLSSG